MEAEGSGTVPTAFQQYAQLEAQMVFMWNKNTQLQEELKKQGKKLERG